MSFARRLSCDRSQTFIIYVLFFLTLPGFTQAFIYFIRIYVTAT